MELLKANAKKWTIEGGAVLSADRRYRYALFRRCGTGPWFVVIGLNPSTADERTDDPTIRRCIDFAKREGCGGLVMLNLFAFRATDPDEMFAAVDPIGEENDACLRQFADDPFVGHVVAAWGTHGSPERVAEVKAIFPLLYCFGRNQNGSPKHPLYLRKNTPLEVFHGREPVGILNADTEFKMQPNANSPTEGAVGESTHA